MDFHDLPSAEDPHQLGVGADLDVGPDQVAWDGVEGPADLEVMIAVDLHPRAERQVMPILRSRSGQLLLLEKEDLRSSVNDQ